MKRTLGTFLFVISTLIVTALFVLNTKSSQTVKNEDVQFHIISSDQQTDHSYYIEVEITNGSDWTLETNHIFVDEMTKETHLSEDNASYTETINRSDADQHADDEQVQGISLHKGEGDFTQIAPGETLTVGFDYEVEEPDSDSLLVVFRSDAIRNEADGLRTHYTTLTDTLDLTSMA
ncbi:hypothetical protein [Salipaludibacillus agaradhaerens]|uniref:hypothetical protein n=1 Tax=Salipaludibacillus agaradhaerens TaxID=76935 RepID=UPI0009960EDD|nr:hypothetical protein [Salipaludibacillus agaradhaerens]